MTANKKPAFRILFLIATPKLVHRAVGICKEKHVPVQNILRAQGTASNEIMDMLGLGGVDKDVLMSVLPKPFADELLGVLRKKLHLGTPNSGVAFTFAMSSGSSKIVKLVDNLEPEQERIVSRRDEYDMMAVEYSMIMTIVNQGYSEEVMNAARTEGATGGTVFHSRQLGSEEAMKFWGISVQPEREVVLILATKENKKQIMYAIGKNCGMHSDARGIVLSVPVDGVVGLD